MKTTLIGGFVLSALLAAAPAFAQSAYGGKTRAEVKAELASARRAGDLDAVNSLSYRNCVRIRNAMRSFGPMPAPAARRNNAHIEKFSSTRIRTLKAEQSLLHHR